MGQGHGQRWRLDRRAESFTVALGLHVLLGAGVIYLAAPPLLDHIKKEPVIEIVTLPDEPPKVIPPQPIERPQVKPVPAPKVAVVQPRTAPPEPVIRAPAPAESPPPPVEPQQEIAEPEVVQTAAPAAPALPIQQPVEDVYIPPDSDAAYLHNPRPAYPLLAQRRGWEGTTLLEVKVSATGQPLSVRVKKSSGYQALDDAALETVRDSYRFEPARRNGEKIAATVELPIRFSLKR